MGYRSPGSMRQTAVIQAIAEMILGAVKRCELPETGGAYFPSQTWFGKREPTPFVGDRPPLDTSAY